MLKEILLCFPQLQMRHLDYKNPIRVNSASNSFACAAAIQKQLLLLHAEKSKRTGALASRGAQISWLHIQSPSLPTPPEAIHLCLSTPEKIMSCHNTFMISSCQVSLSLPLSCQLLAISMNARVILPAFPSRSYFINSSMCISLLVYLLEVKNAFTTSLSMKHSFKRASILIKLNAIITPC